MVRKRKTESEKELANVRERKRKTEREGEVRKKRRACVRVKQLERV